MSVKIFFKHSTRCPISAGAKIEMDRFLQHNEASQEYGVEYELIDVIANRPRSNDIAEQYQIQHESPQIIIVKEDNQVLWTASHRAITEVAIKKALQG